LLKHLPN
jgi:hypothetical protein